MFTEKNTAVNPAAKMIDALALTPRINRAGTHRSFTYLGPGLSGVCLIDAASTGGAYSAFDATVEPGAGVPLHVHTNEDESFYVVDGTFEVRKGNEVYTLEAGMSIYGPRNVPHSFFNVGETTGRVFVVSTPGGFEDFFAGIQAGESVFGDLSTPESQMAFGKLMGEWGIQPVFDAPEPTRMGYPAPAPVVELGNHRGPLLVSAEQTGGALLLAEVEVDPQGGPPPHLHHLEDEAFYVLSGRMEIMVGETIAEIGAGDFAFAPRHIAHGWRNIGEEPAYLVVLVSPGANFQTFAGQMQALISEVGGQALVEMTDPALLGRLGALFAQHGLEPALPAPIK